MSDVVLSPNMNLPVPVVGQDPGPDWATNINTSLGIIDQHTHASGSGVPITPAGIDITTDLTFNSNDATLLRSVRFDPQNSPIADAADLDCIYVSGVDLYYNDGDGNQVRITQSGGVAGSPGSIANLTSPASASYVALSETFVWESDANTPANMDFASAILRNLTANSKGLTLAPPNAMAADYTIVLPALPASQKIMTLDASGNMTAPYTVDNSTIVVATNVIKVPAEGITRTQIYPLNEQISDSSGAFSTASGSPTDVTNLSKSVTTDGLRPVFVGLIHDGNTSNNSSLSAVATSGGGPVSCTFLLVRGSTVLAQSYVICQASPNSGNLNNSVPPGALWIIDPVAAGTYTYKVQCASDGTSGHTAQVNYARLVAYEM